MRNDYLKLFIWAVLVVGIACFGVLSHRALTSNVQAGERFETFEVTAKHDDGIVHGHGVSWGSREARTSMVVWRYEDVYRLEITQHAPPYADIDPHGRVLRDAEAVMPPEIHGWLVEQLADECECPVAIE